MNNKKDNYDSLNELSLFLTSKYSRAAVNISFAVIFVILMLFGGKNPAAAFALFFYNALYFVSVSKYKNNTSVKTLTFKDGSVSYNINEAEIIANRICLPVALILHLILGYGFLFKLNITLDSLREAPLLLLVLNVIIRYAGFYAVKFRLLKKLK